MIATHMASESQLTNWILEQLQQKSQIVVWIVDLPKSTCDALEQCSVVSVTQVQSKNWLFLIS